MKRRDVLLGGLGIVFLSRFAHGWDNFPKDQPNRDDRIRPVFQDWHRRYVNVTIAPDELIPPEWEDDEVTVKKRETFRGVSYSAVVHNKRTGQCIYYYSVEPGT